MLIRKAIRRWRCWWLRRAGACLPHVVRSDAPFFSGDPKGLSCGRDVIIAAGARLIVGRGSKGLGSLKIGDRLFLNHYAIIDCHDEIEVGNDVMIGPHAYVGDFDHDLGTGKSPSIGSTTIGAPVRIGSHVWIGAHAVVLKGTVIEEGAVVAAGAVVTSDVPAMQIVAGIPARIIKTRQPSL